MKVKYKFPKYDKLKHLEWMVYPVVELFPITGNVDEFISWLKEEHGEEMNSEVLDGYKFFFLCAFSGMLNDLVFEENLNIKSDYILDSVSSDFFVYKLPNTCPRTIFLKNIYSYYRPISKAKSAEDLKNALSDFHNAVLIPFNKLFSVIIKKKKHPKFTPQQLHSLFLMGKMYIMFNQLNNAGPVAHSGRLMRERWPPKEQLKRCFKGYKFAVQFTWMKLMGEKEYKKSCLTDLHNTKEWYGFVYDEKEGEEEKDEILKALNETFTIERQTSFDAFFYRIKRDVVDPIDDKKGLEITIEENFFKVDSRNYNKNIFKTLFDIKRATLEEPSDDEKIDMQLLWHHISLGIESEDAVGIFITTLWGEISLLKRSRAKKEKVLVCKFIHPREDGFEGSDYSYGVFLNSKGIMEYSSEWMLFYDACGDWSGSSGAQHRKVEEVLRKFKRQGLINLFTYSIDHVKFRDYISKYVYKSSYERITESVKRTKRLMATNQIKKDRRSIIAESQGLILELIAYYLTSKKEEYQKFTDVKWNQYPPSTKMDPAGQIDILMRNEKQVHIIECKLNPHTQDFVSEADNVRKKLKKYPGLESSFEFWFWYEPNEGSKKKLLELGVNYTYLEKTANEFPNQMKRVFYYNVDKEENEQEYN